MSKPKKLNDIAHIVAIKAGVAEDEVKQLINCFYDEWFIDKLENFENSHFIIEHFGTFVFRKKQYEEILETLNKLRNNYRTQIEKEKTREKKTFHKIVSLWDINIEKLNVVEQKIKELKNKIDTQLIIDRQRFENKIKQYGSK